jgi:succinyl-CoA synthetase alpha subunit
MPVLVDVDTRVCVQGITGRIGRVQSAYMRAAGTRVVCGVTPGKGGSQVDGIPVFDSVPAAVAAVPVDATVLFVPAAAAEPAASEAIEAGVELVVLVTEGVPVHATMRLRARARAAGARIVGPTTPGIIAPGRTKLGIMPAGLFMRGPVGVVSRSGTLSYEIAGLLTAAGIGQSTVVGMGADPVVGTDLQELLGLFAADPETRAVVLIGEVGGSQEERAAAQVAAGFPKPVVAYVAGLGAPPGVRMGHAGAIVQGGMGSAREKLEAFVRAGVGTAATPAAVVPLVRAALSRQEAGAHAG